MSYWTQVSGSVRIDSLVGIVPGRTDRAIKKNLKEALGFPVNFDSPVEDWQRGDKTPTGSEGGIQYEYITTAKDASSISRGVVVIVASLRDFSEKEYPEILEWLNGAFADENHEAMKERGYWVRQGAVELVIEGIKKVLLVWNDETRLFEEHTI